MGEILWRLLPHVLCNTVWEEQNARLFDEKVSGLDKLIVRVMKFLWRWRASAGCWPKMRLEQLMVDWGHILKLD